MALDRVALIRAQVWQQAELSLLRLSVRNLQGKPSEREGLIRDGHSSYSVGEGQSTNLLSRLELALAR